MKRARAFGSSPEHARPRDRHANRVRTVHPTLQPTRTTHPPRTPKPMARRSGTFPIRSPRKTNLLPFTPHAAVALRSEAPIALCGLIGLLAFPASGAALLGHVIDPLLFVAFATMATALFLTSIAKL